MIRKILFFCFIITTFSLFQSCEESEDGPVPGSIIGNVTDADNSEPIRGAMITLNPGGLSANTGSDGRFEFLNLTAGQYTISVSQSDYKSDSKRITVNEGQVASGDIFLKKGESKLRVDPTFLDFGLNATTLTFTVRNTGQSGNISWDISKVGLDWITVSPTSGTLEAGKSQDVIVTVIRSKFDDDVDGSFIVNGNGESYSVAVKATSGSSSGGGTPGGEPNLNAGLIAYYNFDAGNANDATDNEIHANLLNSPEFITETSSGKGKALFLNGLKEQYMNIPINVLKGQANYSFSIWAKDYGGGMLFSAISTDYARSDFPRLYGTTSGKFIFYTKYDSWDNTVPFTYIFKPIQDGKWHMITVVCKSAGTNCEQELYIDGELVDTSTSVFEASKCSKIYIGGNNDGHYANFSQSMKVDNIRFYNRKLMADEVRAIYNLEK